jgi:hypothetical protein
MEQERLRYLEIESEKKFLEFDELQEQEILELELELELVRKDR